MKTELMYVISSGLLLMAAPVRADPPPEYSPSAFVGAILSGPRPCPTGESERACEADPKTRRFTLLAATPAAAPIAPPVASRPVKRRGASAPSGPTPNRPPVQAHLSAANVLLTFATNSDELTPQGRANLKSIAAGLNSDSLALIRFEIAGYTDSSGRNADNLALSDRRASAVKRYLADLGVKSDRLTTAGYGAAHLADPSDPLSELNRRVELHRLN